jgi:hypothetical protein
MISGIPYAVLREYFTSELLHCGGAKKRGWFDKTQ